MTDTKHGDSCSMAFGRFSKEGDCARCDELRTGAPARGGWGRRKRESWREEIRKHDCEKSRCGPVCTAFDW